MNIGRLVAVVSVSHLRIEIIKTLLTVLGMSLGIAVYFAIRTANENAWESFVGSAKLIAPDGEHRLISPSGRISESAIEKLLFAPEVLAVSPRSSRFVPAVSGEKPLGSVQLLGIDFAASPQRTSKTPEGGGLKLLREKNSVLISPQLIERLKNGRLSIVVNGTEKPLSVAGELPDDGLARAFGGQLVLIDIAHFQELDESWGRVDELILTSAPGVTRAQLERAIAPLLPPHIALAGPDDNTRHARKMSDAFHLNLSFLAAMSLLVAIFLIYNTTSYSTLKRRAELSTLRSIGLSARDLLLFLSLENVLLGVLASLLGITIGLALAGGTVKLVSATLSTLYLPVRVSEIRLQPELLVDCFLLGPAAALIGGIFPILEVIARPPRDTASYQQLEQSFLRRLPMLNAGGALLLALAAITSRPVLLERSIYAGFLPPTLLLIGIACLTPSFLRLLLGAARRILRPLLGAEVILAIDHIHMTLRRNAVAVAALIVAVGMFIGLSVMILSFRRTVEDWIVHITKADVYVSTRSGVGGPSAGYLPSELVSFLAASSHAVDYDWVTGTKVRFADREVRVNGVRFENLARHDRLLMKQPMRLDELSSLLERERIALVSEPFAARNKLSIGDTFMLPGIDESVRLTIGNIFYDYSSDQGLVMIADRLFEQLFREPRKQGVSLYLAPGVAPETIRDEVAARFPEAALTVRSNRSLREEVLKVFDDTFKITYALQGIVLFISTLTIINTVLMLILERQRELTVLRALGASRWSIAKMVSYESLFLGLAAALGALVLGLLLAVLLVFVVNRYFFGWSTRFVIPSPEIALTVIGVLALSFLAGLVPGLFAARKLDGSALNYE